MLIAAYIQRRKSNFVKSRIQDLRTKIFYGEWVKGFEGVRVVVCGVGILPTPQDG